MIFDYITEFAGYLNDRGYAVTQNKISRFLSLKNEETDFTREAEIIPLMKLCFCRNKEEADSFSDYFYQYIKDYKGSYAREKQRIRKEHQEQIEYSKSQKEKIQKEITGVRQEIEEKRKAVLEEKEMLHIPKTQKNHLKKQEVKFKQYFTKQEKNLLLSLSKDQTELSEDSKKTFQSLRKKLPEKAEKALLSGKMDAFEIYQNIFKILEKAKIQVIYYEKYIEDKIARETKELKNQQIELENKLQRLEREEKRIQVELDSRLFALTRQFTEKSVSKIHRKNFIGGGAVQLLEEILPEFMEKPFKKLDKKEKEYIYQYIRQNIVSFKTRLGRYLNTQERRKIDMGKTIQAACKTGGIPFEVCFAKSKRNRSNLILILDISGSCKVASEMMLGFMYLLKDVFAGGCRVYVFVNSLYDVTEIMETDSIDKAVQSVLQAVPAKGVYSDYNRPLEMLWKKNRKYLKKDSFILFLGDYRNNKNPSGTEWMKNIHARAKKMFFLNTEQAAKWNQGDSIASVYAAFAPMYEIQTPADLIRFISQIR